MKIWNILESLKKITLVFTIFYIWIASCHYLVYYVDMGLANACFYGGLATIILFLITSPRFKYLINFAFGKEEV